MTAATIVEFAAIAAAATNADIAPVILCRAIVVTLDGFRCRRSEFRFAASFTYPFVNEPQTGERRYDTVTDQGY